MANTLLIIVLFICIILLFITTIIATLAYRNGIKDGMEIAKGNKIPKIEIPKVNIKEEPKPDDLIIEGLNNILTYDASEKKEGKS